MFNQIKEHLSSNSGDTNISKMIMVAIVFVVGAILLVLLTSAFQGPIKGWYDHVVDEWFNHKNGQFSYVVDGNPDSGLDDNELPDVVLPGGDDDGGTEPDIPIGDDIGGGDDDGPAGGNGGGDWGDDGDWDGGKDFDPQPTVPTGSGQGQGDLSDPFDDGCENEQGGDGH